MVVSILVGGLLSPALAFARPVFPEPLLFQLGPTNREIVRAQEQIEQGDFEEAVKTLQAGLDAPDVTDDQLVELYRLLGLASLYLGDEARAREAYERLLQARPDFELPRNAPPKLRQLYARIKEDIKSRRVRPVTLQVDPIPDPTGGEPVVVDARIENMALGAKAKLFFRRAGDEAYSSVDFTRLRGNKEQYQATLPAYELPSEANPYEVEYYFEVADAAQRRLAGRGDSFNPLIFSVMPQPASGTSATASTARPWYKSPWLWVGVGAVVVGGTAAGVAIATSEERGRVPVTIRVNP
ncbi:tetratricopeptide repeat protein [Hyalangium gracile]|uniref:tetratricopeptide repeat protein n=1 Tax=Hyalangium gracile TaxID=394092 RepID=UPI001CCAE637|nr:tetratricopeptide repeat protein [Hyalangium gracile]